jgi:hypothetical protein
MMPEEWFRKAQMHLGNKKNYIQSFLSQTQELVLKYSQKQTSEYKT